MMWTATKPDGTVSDDVFSNIQASKTNHSISRDASDGQFGTWKIQYEYKDVVKIIDIEVEPLIVSVTTDKPSYLPGDTSIVCFSTNYFNPNAARAENMITNIFDVDGIQLQSVDDIAMKVYQPVIIQYFSIDELRDKSFGIFHLVVIYYGIQVNVPFEITNPNSSTSIFLSSNKQVYSPTDPVGLNFVINSVSADSGMLSITLPSEQIITKTISVDNSLTRTLLDDVDTSQTGSYLLQFDYAGNNTVGSFEVYSETQTNSNLSNLELNLTLDKLSYRPGELIQATINTSELIEQDVTYWLEDFSGSPGIQLPFVPSTLGTFTIPHVLSETFLHGPSKLHVKYGPVETFTLFFVAGDVMTDSEQFVTTQYDCPEILLTLDNSAISSQLVDISISPNSELFVLYSDPRVSVFDMQGKLLNLGFNW